MVGCEYQEVLRGQNKNESKCKTKDKVFMAPGSMTDDDLSRIASQSQSADLRGPL
jgi:hypothetical protein